MKVSFPRSNSSRALLVILIILGIATFLVVRPFIFTFILAFVFVLLFEPLYQKLSVLTKRPYLASGLTTAALMLLIVIPVVLIGIVAAIQATSLVTQGQQYIQQGTDTTSSTIRTYVGTIPDNLEVVKDFVQANETSLVDFLITTVKTVTSAVGNNIFSWIGGGISVIVNTVIFLATIVYLFPSKQRSLKELSDLNPIGEQRHDKFVKRFEAVTKATMKSLLIIAVVQGFLGWLIYTVIGLPAATFLGVLQAFVSFVPLGSGVLWVPISTGLILTGSWVQGIIVFAWGLLVISTVDNFIRPILLKDGDAGLPELVTMFSALGGIALFGFWGFLFGPLVASLFLTALEMYKEEYLREKSEYQVAESVKPVRK